MPSLPLPRTLECLVHKGRKKNYKNYTLGMEHVWVLWSILLFFAINSKDSRKFITYIFYLIEIFKKFMKPIAKIE